jgi:hypothetical protein
MKQLLALAVSIAVLGAIWAYLALGTTERLRPGVGGVHCMGLLLPLRRRHASPVQDNRRHLLRRIDWLDCPAAGGEHLGVQALGA